MCFSAHARKLLGEFYQKVIHLPGFFGFALGADVVTANPWGPQTPPPR
jgi:hypothetical protein